MTKKKKGKNVNIPFGLATWGAPALSTQVVIPRLCFAVFWLHEFILFHLLACKSNETVPLWVWWLVICYFGQWRWWWHEVVVVVEAYVVTRYFGSMVVPQVKGTVFPFLFEPNHSPVWMIVWKSIKQKERRKWKVTTSHFGGVLTGCWLVGCLFKHQLILFINKERIHSKERTSFWVRVRCLLWLNVDAAFGVNIVKMATNFPSGAEVKDFGISSIWTTGGRFQRKPQRINKVVCFHFGRGRGCLTFLFVFNSDEDDVVVGGSDAKHNKPLSNGLNDAFKKLNEKKRIWKREI